MSQLQEAQRPPARAGVGDPAQTLVAQALAEAIALHRAGEHAQAAALYAAILQIDPRHADALHLAGALAHQQGMHQLACDLVARALEAAPQGAEAHNTLGAARRAMGDGAGAEAAFRRALALAPAYAEAWQNLGMLHADRGDNAAAIACYRRALEHGGRNPGLLAMLGIAQCAEDRAAAAAESFGHALRSDPRHAAALLGLGEALYILGRLPEAADCFERLLHVDPDSAPAWLGRGSVLLEEGETAAAIACFDRVAPDDPLHAQARWNRSVACLASGDLEAGWRDFHWRWRSRDWDSVCRTYRAPRWSGAPLEASRILLWREQGLGEELLFASMLPEIAWRARRCTLECEPRLLPLFARSFPQVQVVAAGYPPHPATASHSLDWHAPLGDLAPLLRPTLDRFPDDAAYLRADPQRVRAWRERLAALGSALKVGICWRSSNSRGARARACSDIAQWLPLLHASGITLVNLQYDRCDAELAHAAVLAGRAIVAFPEVDMRNDLDETAALIAALDLVVSAPTTVSLLAAALGVPTWQLTCGADWHALGQAGSPWQPRLRRFHRRWDERWDEVLERIAAALPRRLTANTAA